MEWDWQFAFEIIPTLLRGVRITILATLLSSVVALIVGLVIAVLRRSSIRGVARATVAIVNFIRGTPLLVQLYFIFYVLPDAGILLSPLMSGVLGLGLHYGVYVSEVYRAGIDNLPKGQWDAARAVNLTRLQTWLYVVFPQAIPPMIPALANYFVAMFKETPLLSAITVVELMSEARIVSNFYYRYLEPMTLVGVFFLAVSVPSVIVLRWIERRFKPLN